MLERYLSFSLCSAVVVDNEPFQSLVEKRHNELKDNVIMLLARLQYRLAGLSLDKILHYRFVWME